MNVKKQERATRLERYTASCLIRGCRSWPRLGLRFKRVNYRQAVWWCRKRHSVGICCSFKLGHSCPGACRGRSCDHLSLNVDSLLQGCSYRPMETTLLFDPLLILSFPHWHSMPSSQPIALRHRKLYEDIDTNISIPRIRRLCVSASSTPSPSRESFSGSGV